MRLSHVLTFLALTLTAWTAAAQPLDAPLAITGATVVVAPGESFENATILIEHGRIAAVGTEVAIPDYARRIDATGLVAYAGFIDAATHLGVKAKGPTKEDLDRVSDPGPEFAQGPHTSMAQANRQDVWPQLTVFDVYEKDNDALDAHRQAGFAVALVSPRHAILGGKGDLMQLGDKPVRSSVIAAGLTQIVAGGPEMTPESFRTRAYPGSPMGVVAQIRQLYYDGEWYRQRKAQFARYPTQVERPAYDPVLEAMAPLLDRREMWIAVANEPNEIHHALDLAAEFNQRIAILGGKEAYKVVDRLKAEHVPVIVSLDWKDKPELAPKKDQKAGTSYTTVSWTPAFEKDFYEPLAVRRARVAEWEEHVDNLKTLIAAGVPVAVTTRDNKDAKDFWKRARESIEHGLTADELLAALTTGPASIYNASGQLGRIAPGRLANVTLMTKPLGEKGAQVRHLFVDGEQFTFQTSAEEKKDEEKKDGDTAESGDADESAATADEPKDDEKTDDAEPEDLHPWDAELPAQRDKQSTTNGDLLLKNATVITVANGTLQNADVLILDGRIADIGPGLEAPAAVTTMDLTGYWVMPGIIDPHSHMAVTGVNEFTQSITCEVRQADVIDHTQLAVHRAIAGGVTTIHTMHGSANTIGGQNAVVKLKFDTSPREMLVATGPRIVKFALGENVTRERSTPRFPNSRMGVESVLRMAFNAAIEYDREWNDYLARTAQGQIVPIPRRDIRLEALRDIYQGSIWIHSHCYRADEILRLLAVAQDYGVRVATLQHVLEGYRIAPEIYNHGAGASTFSDWWSYKKEAFDAIPYNAPMTLRAGIVTSLNSDDSGQVRHMNLEAAKMLRYGGLTADEALRLITINPAIQLGLDSRIGSLERGKDGDVAVFTRHPLDTFAKNVMTVIEGEIFFTHPGTVFDGSQPGPGVPDVPRPARTPLHLEALPASDVYAIVNAEIHPVGAPVIARGTLVIRGGKIAALGADTPAPADATLVDAAGLRVYPGLINSATQLGLVEIAGLAQTVDARELARFQPELQAMSAINPHSEHFPVSYCEGITTAHVLPSGGFVSGRAAFVQLDGWTMPQMLRSGETGLVMDLPVLPVDIPEDDVKKRTDEHRKRYEQIEEFMRTAQYYVRAKSVPASPLPNDLRMAAMAPYFNGDKPIFFRANTYKEILQVLAFADAFQITPVIVGGGDAWKCAKQLAERNVPVIVTTVFDEARGRYDRFDAFYTNPARLEAAGVLFSIAMDGAEFARQLSVNAGYAVAYGLSEDRALRAITLDAAEILGVAGEVGSLEAGKIADVIITTGDPLQASSRTVGMFMAGRPVELTSLHERSYEKFTNRPQPALEPAPELRGPPAMHAEPASFATTD